MSKVTITPKRQSTGVYGTVQAYEPVEVDSDLAKDLLKTGNWINGVVDKEDRPKVFALPIGATISEITEDPEQVLDAEHLAAEVDRLGKLAADLDTREAALNDQQIELDARQVDLDQRQSALETRAVAQNDEGQRLTALAEELGARDKTLNDLGVDLDTRQTMLTEGEARLAADREAHEKAMAPVADADAKGKKADK